MESSGLRSDFPHFIHEDVKVALQNDFDSLQHFERLLTWLRSPPLITVVQVNSLEPSWNNNHEITKLQLQYSLHARYGTRFTIEYHPRIHDLLVIPSIVQSSDNDHRYPEAIVDVRCGVAVLRGVNVFSTGILALSPGVIPYDKVSIYVDVKGMCRRGDKKKFDGLKTFVGNGILLLSRKKLFSTVKKSKDVAITILEPFSPSSIEFRMANEMLFQDLPSIIRCRVLNPLPNEWVLDMCAAPGCKTLYLADVMDDQGKLVALDKSKAKIKVIKSYTSGLKCVTAFAFNAAKAVDVKLDLKITSNIAGPGPPPYPYGTFDRILLDAPCSTLGHRPQLCVNMSTAQLNSYPVLQKKLFSTAVDLLKDGGTLVYCTCTLTLAENECVVEWALSSFPILKLDVQKPYIGESGFAGTSLTPEELSLLQRFDFRSNDFYVSKSIGFFIAKFIKQVL